MAIPAGEASTSGGLVRLSDALSLFACETKTHIARKAHTQPKRIHQAFLLLVFFIPHLVAHLGA